MSELSVVVPVHGNAATLPELHRRLRAAAGTRSLQLILVDDASPDRSREAIAELAADDPGVEPVLLERNVGQHAAVIEGLRRARGSSTVVMDADLQDPPEAIPALLGAAGDSVDVVFAGRRGRYESRRRLLTSRLFKRTLAATTGLPPDAGMFFAANRRSVDALLEMNGSPPFVVAMIGRAGLRTRSIPVERGPANGSSYTGAMRLRAAAHGLRWAAQRTRRTAASAGSIDAHNAVQRAYYARGKARMEPRRSRYLERHIDELWRFAGLAPGQRVLEVGPGQGRYSLQLADRGLELEVLELVPEMLELLDRARGGRRIELHRGDVLSPPEEVRPGFDAVIGFFALHHMHDVRGCIASMARLLRPGGRLAFLEPNAFNPLYYAQIALSPDMTWAGDRGMLEMRPGPLLDAVRRAGLADARIERFGVFPPAIANRPRAGAVERGIERIAPLRPLLPFQLIGGRALDAGAPRYR
jgi:SAM-dependent methyltransferase